MIDDFLKTKARVAIVASDPMAAVVEAVALRRRGISVYTQFSGNRKRQLKRAYANAEEVIDLDGEPRFRMTPLEEIVGV